MCTWHFASRKQRRRSRWAPVGQGRRLPKPARQNLVPEPSHRKPFQGSALGSCRSRFHRYRHPPGSTTPVSRPLSVTRIHTRLDDSLQGLRVQGLCICPEKDTVNFRLYKGYDYPKQCQELPATGLQGETPWRMYCQSHERRNGQST